MLFRFCLYGFLKSQRYFEPFLMLVFLQQGISYFVIGLLVACRSVTVNLLEIPSGVLADAWGRRGCMIFSFLAYIASFVVFALARSVAWYFPAMVLFGVGESFRTGTHKAMIFEWLRLQGRENERTKVYGITRSWSKFGSAVSSVLAAVFVIVTGDYRSIFLFATIPYAINIVNFLGYPKQLDGAHEKSTSIRSTFRHLQASLAAAWQRAEIRRLTVESMSWDGLFLAIKDYLQPVLALLAAQLLTKSLPLSETPLTAGQETETTALLIGVVYTMLFLLSGVASRYSYRVAQWHGGELPASRWLWFVQVLIFAAFTLADCQQWTAGLALVFILISVNQNLWRPILISRYDESTPPEQGATMMSIESQARRLATFVFAPTIGYCIDWVADHGHIGQYWPIGVVGMLVSLMMVASFPKSTQTGTS